MNTINQSHSFESQVEKILSSRFGLKIDCKLKGLMAFQSPTRVKAFETAVLCLTMELITSFKKANSAVQTKELIEHIRYSLEKLDDMAAQQEISTTLHLSCQQELNKLIYENPIN